MHTVTLVENPPGKREISFLGAGNAAQQVDLWADFKKINNAFMTPGGFESIPDATHQPRRAGEAMSAAAHFAPGSRLGLNPASA